MAEVGTEVLDALPTPEEAAERQELAVSLEHAVKQGLSAGRVAIWVTAQALYEFDEASAWKALEHDKLNDWLAQPDIGLSQRVYYRLVKSYRELVVKKEIEPARLALLDVLKVDAVLPAIEEGRVSVEDALSDAEVMPHRDLRIKYGVSGSAGRRRLDPDTAPPVIDVVGNDGPEVEEEPAGDTAWAIAQLQDAYDSNHPHPRVRREALERVLELDFSEFVDAVA